MITLKDFKEVTLENSLPHRYYSMKRDSRELTLEPCMGGFDVALYDTQGNIQAPKLCTSLTKLEQVGDYAQAMQTALSYANQLWEQSYED